MKSEKGFIPIIFIIIGAVVATSVVFGVVKYKDEITTNVYKILKTGTEKPTLVEKPIIEVEKIKGPILESEKEQDNTQAFQEQSRTDKKEQLEIEKQLAEEQAKQKAEKARQEAQQLAEEQAKQKAEKARIEAERLKAEQEAQQLAEEVAKKQQQEYVNNILPSIQEHVDKRAQERKTKNEQLIAGLNEIFDKYQDQLDQLWVEIDELEESPAYKRCSAEPGQPLVLCTGRDRQEWHSVLVEIDLKNNEIMDLQGERSLELQSYYPAGNWFQSGDTVSTEKLFSVADDYITVHTPYGSTDFSVVPKSGGGYYLRDLSANITFEVTQMPDGDYYVNY